jgi:hypothetical protein
LFLAISRIALSVIFVTLELQGSQSNDEVNNTFFFTNSKSVLQISRYKLYISNFRCREGAWMGSGLFGAFKNVYPTFYFGNDAKYLSKILLRSDTLKYHLVTKTLLERRNAIF